MENLTYKFKLGNIEGFVLSVINSMTTAGDLVVNATLEELEPAVKKYGFTPGDIPTSINNLLFKAGEETILVDTGIPMPGGNMFAALEELEINPGEIDFVVITHSDLDHIGAILDEDGEVAFPNARHVMLYDAWQFWQTEESRLELSRLNKWGPDSHVTGWEMYSKVRESMIFPRSGDEFLPGFQLLSAAGHRYDHSVVRVSSAGEQLMHLADTVNHPIFLENRQWFSKYDANPVQNEETKQKLLDMCAAEEMLVCATHFPFPGLGHIRQEGDHWTWLPVI